MCTIFPRSLRGCHLKTVLVHVGTLKFLDLPAGHLYGEAWHLACPAERLSKTEVLDGRSSTDTCVEWLCKGRLFPLEEKDKTLFSLPLLAVVMYLWRPSAPPCCCQPCLGDVWTPSWSFKLTTCPREMCLWVFFPSVCCKLQLISFVDVRSGIALHVNT